MYKSSISINVPYNRELVVITVKRMMLDIFIDRIF